MTEQDHRAATSPPPSPGQVWLRSERPRKQRVTRERIVETALALLDEEGAERLTMRRLAERLDTGSTTLYGHVATKDDVLDLALDAVYAEVDLPGEPGPDWAEDLRGFMTDWRAALLRHPWSAGLLGRPMLGPNMLAREEFLYSVLARAGLPVTGVSDAAYAVSNYVIGSTLMQASWQTQPKDARKAADEHVQTQRDRYPTLAAHRRMAATDWDATFARGLRALIDGLAPAST
ncbi:TetR/AcrR family transcriptional regulator C-terminal domain-containing protein [Spiractinospora alimapuensis]|uniref:TetR/AcrR family transcriptional regulator n=1 Tax=Spiractinospora alimapuensis TaxID=2820884 RepID=UPI001F2CC821|nr:TetR/AcrR family transcriptional regulator [Spiractinospora alimapuensis]QVQ52655.1 TetR/AcrR family transcriptional regulator C-terminal domain-containing protein [Spiractinospora alimapuensis]